MTSPEVQRHAIESFAQANNIVIVDTVEGLDESGSRSRSAWWPRLEQTIDRMAAGEIELIVVWKFSRIGRARLRWAVALDRVDSLGGSILSATEPIESSTASGKFARGLLGEVNAYQADLIGETWKDSHDRRVRHGMPANGKPRFGYAYTRETGFTPDPVSGPILGTCYRRYIAGESIYSLVRWMNDGPTRPVTGYGPAGDGLWSDRTLRRVLDSGFGAGLIRHHGELHSGIHPAVITPDEWAEYLDARERRRGHSRGERSEYLLSGLVRCACGSPMHAGLYGTNRAAKYRCKDAHEKRTHAGGYVTADLVERHVVDWLRRRHEDALAARDEYRAATPRPRAVADPSREIRNQIARTQSDIDRLSTRAVELDMPRDVYQRQLAPMTERLQRLEAEERSIEARARKPLVMHSVDVFTDWESFSIPQRREMLRAVIHHVEVTPGRPRATMRVVGRE
ncbi:DNA invertase Pin-like site-specific DNA recombinase [Microbacterium marinum]|uniref:DNA invertase Pin-like site-specific DNA recombinase n=2 Tax=Microbacterium marinum TaxID=421115 RepID=A0A7W7BQF4_9MICO|nr:DNA invertase Pin-like site-specific DNA recombinase [Microbacterium marinum]